MNTRLVTSLRSDKKVVGTMKITLSTQYASNVKRLNDIGDQKKLIVSLQETMEIMILLIKNRDEQNLLWV